MEQVMPAIGQAVTNALKQLLSEKHLYQYTEVDLSCVSTFAKMLHDDWKWADSPMRTLRCLMIHALRLKSILKRDAYLKLQINLLFSGIFSGSFFYCAFGREDLTLN